MALSLIDACRSDAGRSGDGFEITAGHLNVVAKVAGTDSAKFMEVANVESSVSKEATQRGQHTGERQRNADEAHRHEKGIFAAE